ncbi:N-acetylmuramoyl-L-alanine amidase [Aneurinibacillus thermoaerophilus]|uniref:N-acetylmuramoyl-L-alanine amidase n=1 Tax=Aneurinibacillus thermoaerophilus TaxID=143495 RepID=UPI002E1B1EE3|nr:N-acetylmuramoyl-L-alanine amidase [Aneurinibacillus thermoaerophilus]MED0736780.1 N-acetylmuramoyl-L-alanine amidase [Aneurinibacillus thermoaerophilus]
MKKAWRRIGIFLFLLLGVWSATVQAASNASIQLWMNGKRIKPDVPPQLINGRMLVPIYIVQEGMGMKVEWDAKTRRVTVSNGSKKVELTIHSKTARVNSSNKKLDVAPVIISNRTFLPFRAVGELLGMEVGWEEKTKSVILNNPVQLRINGQAVAADIYNHNGTYFVDAQKIAASTGYTIKSQKDKVVFVKDGEAKTVSAGLYKKIDNKITVPLSFLAELVHGMGSWNASKTIYTLTSQAERPASEEQPKKPEAKPEAPAKIKVTGISQSGNVLEIKTIGKPRAKDQVMKAPFRIVIDVQNAQLAIASPLPLNGEANSAIKEVRYSQFSPDTVRVVMELVGSAKYDLVSNQDGIQVRLKDVQYPQPPVPVPPATQSPDVPAVIEPSNGGEGSVTSPSEDNVNTPTSVPPVARLSSKEKVKIVVDAGHGGTDSGAGGNGLKEKDLTLGIAQRLANKLRADSKFQVIMTREGDTYPTLAERVELANKENADLFISVHINSATSASAKGTETYYYTEKSKEYAQTIHKYFVEATGFYDRKVKTAKFYVIKNTKMPAVLVEVGFITNPTEAKEMAKDEFQQRVADALYTALREYVEQH